MDRDVTDHLVAQAKGMLCHGVGINQKQRLPIFDGDRALNKNFYDSPIGFGFNFIHELHRFYDTQYLAFFYEVAFLHIGVCIR